MAGYYKDITLSFMGIMYRILPWKSRSSGGALVKPAVTSPFYRLEAGPWGPNGEIFPAGTVHGGIDMQYEGGSLDPINTERPPVYSPVGGAIVEKETGWNGIVIQTSDGTYHRLGHLLEYAINPTTGIEYKKGDLVGSGTAIGREGDTAAPGAIHVHYDIFLESGLQSGYQGPESAFSDTFIDPIVYWTYGVNPYANDLNSKGLYAYATPVTDYNANGQIDTPETGLSESGAFVREGQASVLAVGVNTPHTQPLTLRLAFSQVLDGYSGSDVLHGGLDTDTLHGGAGSDALFGEEGNDTLYGDSQFGAGTFLIRYTGQRGALYSDNPSFTGSFGLANDVAEAEAGADTLDGGEGQDTLYGGAGNDTLHGGADHDTLQGEGGHDLLFGGQGNDILWGDSDPVTDAADEIKQLREAA